MIRQPPRSTLFPDTTRFRSDGDGPRAGFRREGASGGAQGGPPAVAGAFVDGDRVQLTDPKGRLHTVVLEPGKLFHNHRDRKSTRLNSSHANISYAVFCLKKN